MVGVDHGKQASPQPSVISSVINKLTKGLGAGAAVLRRGCRALTLSGGGYYVKIHDNAHMLPLIDMTLYCCECPATGHTSLALLVHTLSAL